MILKFSHYLELQCIYFVIWEKIIWLCKKLRIIPFLLGIGFFFFLIGCTQAEYLAEANNLSVEKTADDKY
jgi:hypothetical protein